MIKPGIQGGGVDVHIFNWSNFKFASIVFVPHSPALWIAAGFLWILDASINISMEPFRALVADKLHESQRSYGFVVQTLIIGIGTWVASNLPWIINQLGVSNEAGPGIVPLSVKVAFAIGAFVFLVSILYTVFTTEEYPPENMEAFRKMQKESKGNFFKDIMENMGNMPSTMKKLGVIQFFSWFAFFTMWSLAMPALTEHIYQAPAPVESAYDMTDAAQSAVFLRSTRNIKMPLIRLDRLWGFMVFLQWHLHWY